MSKRSSLSLEKNFMYNKKNSKRRKKKLIPVQWRLEERLMWEASAEVALS